MPKSDWTIVRAEVWGYRCYCVSLLKRANNLALHWQWLFLSENRELVIFNFFWNVFFFLSCWGIICIWFIDSSDNLFNLIFCWCRQNYLQTLWLQSSIIYFLQFSGSGCHEDIPWWLFVGCSMCTRDWLESEGHFSMWLAPFCLYTASSSIWLYMVGIPTFPYRFFFFFVKRYFF